MKYQPTKAASNLGIKEVLHEDKVSLLLAGKPHLHNHNFLDAICSRRWQQRCVWYQSYQILGVLALPWVSLGSIVFPSVSQDIANLLNKNNILYIWNKLSAHSCSAWLYKILKKQQRGQRITSQISSRAFKEWNTNQHGYFPMQTQQYQGKSHYCSEI